MIFETNRGPMTATRLVDELTYINYASNRDAFPHIAPERYTAMGFANVPAMEERYQRERAKEAA